jgi:DUF1680 family protein
LSRVTPVTTMNELTSRQVTITNRFWSPRLAVNATQAIFHQWREPENELTFIPYQLWANRGASQMTVWVNV